MTSLDAFQLRIKYTFKNTLLLQEALTHRSFVYEYSLKTPDNERLEFLGDALIGSCVAQKLFDMYPDYPEGALSQIKSFLVSKKFLAMLAREIKLGKYLKLGVGEEKNGGRNRVSLLGNGFEALAGALFLDSDYDTLFSFLWTRIEPKMDTIEEQIVEQNIKNIFQAYVQKNFNVLPTYVLKETTGPFHDRIYVYDVYVGKELMGSGSDSSKKKASAKAARAALDKLNLI